MPCGLPAGTDLFVVTDSAGQRAGDAAASTAAAAAEASAVRASQAKLGENSYYYSVNKNLGNTITEPEPLVPKAKRVVSAVLRQTTISNYAMIDGEGKVKVNIPLAGAQALAANAIVLSVFDRAFKLRIRTDASSELTLNIPILLEEIMQHECAVKVLNGRVVIHLPKRDADRVRAACTFAPRARVSARSAGRATSMPGSSAGPRTSSLSPLPIPPHPHPSRCLVRTALV